MKKKNAKQLLVISCSFFILCSGLLPSVMGVDSWNQHEVVDFVVQNILKGSKNDVLLYIWGPVEQGTDVVGLKEYIFQTQSAGYVVYIDPYPTANMFHPVTYVFVNEKTGESEIKEAKSPPLNFEDYQLIETEISDRLFSVENRRALRSTQSSIQQGSKNQHIWAVLMNGGVNSYNNHVRYWNDLSNIYCALSEVYGYDDDHIIVLCSDGLDPAPDQSNGMNSNPDLDGDGDDDIMYSCTLANIELVFSDLASLLSAGDKLLIFTTDHGSSNGGWNVVLNLWNNEELTDSYFASLLADLPECEIIATFEQCFSGGFLDDVVVPPGPISASSACRYDEYSYAMSNLEYDEYVFHWTAAVKGEDAYGVVVNADYNADGCITMDEAFLYAETHDVEDETPQYSDYPVDVGMMMSLGISNIAPEKPEQPQGPGEGGVFNQYSYTTTTTDPEGDQIYYQWDWDDGTFSDWFGPYLSNEMVTASYMWTVPGQYLVRVKAKDAVGYESNWSDPLGVNIVDVPLLEIGEITGGFFINAVVTNQGADAVGVDTTITVDGQHVFFGQQKKGKIPSLPNNGQAIIQSDVVLGFGPIDITVEASYKESVATKTVHGRVLLFFILV